MALDHGYGVVAGTFASFSRDDPDDFGHWYHGKLRVATPGGEYEAALDVDTPSGVGVSYRLVDDLSVADIPELDALAPGFTALPSAPAGGALDYVRSPILHDGWVVTWLRRVVVRLFRSSEAAAAAARGAWAPTGVDTVLGPLRRWLPMLRWRSFPWVRSDGDNALDVLEPLLSGAVRLYVLGEPYTSGLGVHNVHMNQGDPPGPHQGEDGVWQDGAVVSVDASGVVRVWQVRFNTQSLHTGPDGLPI